tara:strand:- start:1038 stop:1313 length:276 start_codon:yes stop_codon:yes gene_type:complete
MDNYFIVYTKDGCNFCDKAVSLLKEKETPFIVTDMTNNVSLLEEVAEKSNHKTVPLIHHVDGFNTVSVIGGFSDLEQMFTELEELEVKEDD